MSIKYFIFFACYFIFFPASAQQYPEMIDVPGGSFNMGGTEYKDEKPIHKVTLTSFSIAKTETTVAQWRVFCNATARSMPNAPNWGWIDNYPIVNVNWNDAVAYCNWLSKKTGKRYRLPTEAEWEYAARGGSKSKGYTYAGSDNIDGVGWNNENAASRAYACGLKRSNELGLYDMSGNVSEWCNDWYGESYYADCANDNPKGPYDGSYRIVRGGSWYNSPTFSKVEYRTWEELSKGYSNFGFRVVLSIDAADTDSEWEGSEYDFDFDFDFDELLNYPIMIDVPGGSFSMGGAKGTDEKPIHQVTLNSFFMAKTETTVKQWKFYCTKTGKKMPKAPSWGWIDNYPIVNVSWNEAVDYCNWLSKEEGQSYRLPTEAEWEYAARGGNKSKGYIYAGSDYVDGVSWNKANAGSQAHDSYIKSKSPNELGLFNMSGNVWEWCSDWYSATYYAKSPSTNPQGPSVGSSRVVRGGSFNSPVLNCRVASRYYNVPTLVNSAYGFRVVFSL